MPTTSTLATNAQKPLRPTITVASIIPVTSSMAVTTTTPTSAIPATDEDVRQSQASASQASSPSLGALSYPLLIRVPHLPHAPALSVFCGSATLQPAAQCQELPHTLPASTSNVHAHSYTACPPTNSHIPSSINFPSTSAPTTGSATSTTELTSPTLSCPNCRRTLTSHIGLVRKLRVHRTKTDEPVPGATTNVRCLHPNRPHRLVNSTISWVY
ncbi:hypothetical protein SprV_0602099900 [Sparganum proliferum]